MFPCPNSSSHQTDVDCPEGEVAADEDCDQEAGHPRQPPLPCHVGVDPAEGLDPQPRQGILQEVGHRGVGRGLPRAENQRQTGGWGINLPSCSVVRAIHKIKEVSKSLPNLVMLRLGEDWTRWWLSWSVYEGVKRSRPVSKDLLILRLRPPSRGRPLTFEVDKVMGVVTVWRAPVMARLELS